MIRPIQEAMSNELLNKRIRGDHLPPLVQKLQDFRRVIPDCRTLPSVSMQYRTLELCYTVQDSQTLQLVSMQSWTTWLCLTFQCSPRPSNLATRSNAVQGYRTSLYVQCRSGLSNLTTRFTAVQDFWMLLYLLMQFWALEPCYKFQCSSGLSNRATRLNAGQD